MKQNITIQQWDEITHDQKDKLDNYHDKNTWTMSIGQMIWFLGNEFYSINVLPYKNTIRFIVSYKNKSFKTITDNLNSKPRELCDQLWEAVKEKV